MFIRLSEVLKKKQLSILNISFAWGGRGSEAYFLEIYNVLPPPPPHLFHSSYYLDQLGTSKNKFLRMKGLQSWHEIKINNKSTIATKHQPNVLIWSLILKPSSFFLFNSNNFMRVIKHTESIFILIVSKIQINFTLKLISTIGF